MGMLPTDISAYDHYKSLREAARAALEKKPVTNKIFMNCATLGCPSTGPLSPNEGRPKGWFSVDIEGPFVPGRVSTVLCPACATTNLGDLIPKAQPGVAP